MKNAWLLVAGIVLFTGCTKTGSSPAAAHAGKTPDEVVKRFVELSAGAKSDGDKKLLKDLCQGDMARTFERMNDEAFRLIYVDSKITVLELKVLETKVDGDSAKVAYQVTVDNKQGTDPTREVNQREVDLAQVNGSWFISSIHMRGSDQVAFTRGMLF